VAKRRLPSWVPQFVIPTASALTVIVLVSVFGRSRLAIAESVRWLAHPVDTPRVVFVLMLALAAAAGVMLVTALARRLFGSRAHAVTLGRWAEDFRSAWESLADHLRRWQRQSDIAEEDANLQEQYRDFRRATLETYARVRDDFRLFLEQNVGWDLRESLPIELDPSDVYQEAIVGPFEHLWEFANLPATMRWVREMTPNEFSTWIGQRSDALNAFVTWMHDR